MRQLIVLCSAAWLLTACEGDAHYASLKEGLHDFVYPKWLEEQQAKAAGKTEANVAVAKKAEKVAKRETKTETKPELSALLDSTPVGKTVGVGDAKENSAQLSVLEEYDSATGEQCRRYAWFAAATEQGKIQTACRANKSEDWIALRDMSHETLSPLATLPNFRAAAAAPVLPVDVQ